MVVNNYGKSLKLNSKQQTLELKALANIIETPHTKAHGLLTMSESDIEINLRSIRSEVSRSVLRACSTRASWPKPTTGRRDFKAGTFCTARPLPNAPA